MTKRSVYPIIITEESDGFYVSIPDFATATQGESIADAIMMARDAIGLMGIDMQDEGKELPIPYWLSVEAEKVGINYSRILQEALMNILGLQRKIY